MRATLIEDLTVKIARSYSPWGTHFMSRRRTLCLYAFVMLTVFLFPSAVCFAQNITGDLLGTATDPSGAIVPNATVTATEVQTQLQRTTSTNGQGEYTLSQMKSGTYRISVSATRRLVRRLHNFKQEGLARDRHRGQVAARCR